MKKKLLVLLGLMTVLMCLFAISVNAAVEEHDGIFYDLNSSKLTAAVTNANQKCTLETVIIPDTIIGNDGKEYKVTSVNQTAFQGNKNVKYISLSKNVTWIGAAAFRDVSNLVFFDFNDNQNSISFGGYGVFLSCSSLKAICFPDNITNIPDQFLTNGKSLTAVYLPANVEYIRGNKGANDGPALGKCPNMYLVNEKFEVRDENGNFYTAETFVPPARPDIYFMPSSLKCITGSYNSSTAFQMDKNGMVTNASSEDCAFYGNTNINPVIVMPESYCGFDDRVVSGGNAQITDFKGDTVSNGLFQGCGTAEKPLTVVFLGKVDRVSMDRKDGGTKYTTYIFANPANTGFEDTKIGTWYNTSDTNYKNQDEMYVIFCHANNGAGAKYKVGFKGSDEDNKYPVLISELQENAVTHMANPNCKPYNCEPDCVKDRMTGVIDCFCGNVFSYESIEVGTALGHDYDVANGAKDFGIVYLNYMDKGIHTVSCARCDYKDGISVDALFEDYGYSVTETAINGKYSMVQCYKRNQNAYDAYVAQNEGFEFGVVVSVVTDPLNPANSALIESKQTYITGQGFIAHDYFDIGISGIDESSADVKLTFCAFVKDSGEVFYLDGGETVKIASAKSYADLAPNTQE